MKAYRRLEQGNQRPFRFGYASAAWALITAKEKEFCKINHK
jgi:hypothetical protein